MILGFEVYVLYRMIILIIVIRKKIFRVIFYLFVFLEKIVFIKIIVFLGLKI